MQGTNLGEAPPRVSYTSKELSTTRPLDVVLLVNREETQAILVRLEEVEQLEISLFDSLFSFSLMGEGSISKGIVKLVCFHDEKPTAFKSKADFLYCDDPANRLATTKWKVVSVIDSWNALTLTQLKYEVSKVQKFFERHGAEKLDISIRGVLYFQHEEQEAERYGGIPGHFVFVLPTARHLGS